MKHVHDWKIIDRKDENIIRSHSLESESYTISKCDCGATKHDYHKTIVQGECGVGETNER